MKNSNTPIKKHLHDYLDWIDVQKGLSSKTQENYTRFLNRFFEWLDNQKLSELLPHELLEDHVWDYRIYLARQTISERSGETLAKSTQQYYLIALRSLLTYFAARNLRSLPSDKIELPKQDKNKHDVRFLNIDQLKRLFDAPNIATKSGLRDRTILEVLFSTGLRISELTALDRLQFNHCQNSNTFELSITGKGSKTRTVYFSERCLDWVKKYLDSRTDDHKPLFINYRRKQGTPRRLSDRYIQQRLKHYALKAGLPSNTTPHVLRHSFATNLLGKGVDIRILQEFLGHSSITATQIYAHVTNKQLRDIHEQFHGGDSL